LRKPLLISWVISFGIFIVLSPVFIRLVCYLHPIVLAVLLFCILVLVYFCVLLIRKETIHLSYPLFLSLLILYTVAMLILLFFRPNEQGYNSMNLVPFSTVMFYLSGKGNWLISFYNLAANIGLFIPYGIYLKLNNFPQLKAWVISLLTIACIEFLQFVSQRGSLDIDDLMLNLLGVFLGYWLYPLFKRVIMISLKK
jgi:glycopeptide antibiotics resistance protein